MPKIVKGSKIPGDLRFTANDQHMADLIAMQRMVDEDTNLPIEKIRFYAGEMWKEFMKKQNEKSSYFLMGTEKLKPGEIHGHNYYSSREAHPGPRTDRDQLKLFEDVE
tara:strand:+ start:85 stop:408 length:324 start_codon:yes stop_codon:yes gene_type:complete